MDGTLKQRGYSYRTGFCQCKTPGTARPPCGLDCPRGHSIAQKSAGLELRMELLSHFAGDNCHQEQLNDLLKVTQSADDWTPSTGLLLTPSASWPLGALPVRPPEILWFQFHLDLSSSTLGPGPPAGTKLPSTLSIFCGEQFVSYIPHSTVSLHVTHKSLFIRQWASCCLWGAGCYNGAF